MSAIAIISPDGNRVVGFRSDLPLPELSRAFRGNHLPAGVQRIDSVDTRGDWPFQFDRIFAAHDCEWKEYAPDDLPIEYW